MAYGDDVTVQFFPDNWLKENCGNEGHIATKANGYDKVFVSGFDLDVEMSDWSVDVDNNELTIIFDSPPNMYIGMVMEILNSGVDIINGRWRIKKISGDLLTYTFFSKTSVTIPSVLNLVYPTFRVASLGMLPSDVDNNYTDRIEYKFKNGFYSQFSAKVESNSYYARSGVGILNNGVYYDAMNNSGSQYITIIGNGYGHRFTINYSKSIYYHGMVDGGYYCYEHISDARYSSINKPYYNNLFMYNNNVYSNTNSNDVYGHYYYYKIYLFNDDGLLINDTPMFLSNQYRRPTITWDKTVMSHPAITFKSDITKSFRIPSYVLTRKIEPEVKVRGFHLAYDGTMVYTYDPTPEGNYVLAPINDKYWNIDGVEQEWY